MKLCASCMRCLVDRQEERVRDKGKEEDRDAYMRQVARIIGESAPEDSAPVLVERINEVYRQYFGPVTDYDEIKKEFNELMLSLEPDIRSVMEAGRIPYIRHLYSPGLPIILISAWWARWRRKPCFSCWKRPPETVWMKRYMKRCFPIWGRHGK